MPTIPARPLRPAQWSSPDARRALEFILEGIAEMAGFQVVGISVLREDGMLQALTVVGSDEAREVLESTLAPAEPFVALLAHAERWGLLHYLPAEVHRLPLHESGWVPDTPRRRPGEDRWDPHDLLVAPMHDGDGRFVGFVGLDLPRDGRVPAPSRRADLDRYARQAVRAVLTTLEREQLAERVRLADAAAEVVRNVSGRTSVEEVLEVSRQALQQGFRTQRLWIELFDEPTRNGLSPAGVRVVRQVTARAWAEGTTLVLARDQPAPGIARADLRVLREIADEHDLASVLLVPLGAGEEAVGALGLARREGEVDWSADEVDVALDVGRDLGRAVAAVRATVRERELLSELQQVAEYKTRLVATISHELKNPLTAILGNLELLEDEEGMGPHGRRAVEAITRGGHRLRRAIDELLLLYRTEVDQDLVRVPVDLHAVVDDVVVLNAAGARGRGLELRHTGDPGPLLVLGDRDELYRVVANLVGNALKYTREGSVTVTVTSHGEEVELCVSDTGIGIGPADQARLFDDLYRGTNPEALAQPGTGLGLAIVRRVVERHRGRIELTSQLGEGTRVRVSLPAVP